MASRNEPAKQQKSLQNVVDQLDRYPIEAFYFVQQGLSYTVEKIHGGKGGPDADSTSPESSRHVTGQQLCEGLREFALMNWGLLALTVLRRWEISSTSDFGRIVYAMIEGGLMQRTEADSIEDFRGVYEFRKAFESGYRITPEMIENTATEGRP